MKKTYWRSSILSLVFLALGSTGSLTAALAQQESRDDEEYARPRDLVALQDDLNQMELSLGMLPARHPRSEQFRTRATAIREDVSALTDRIGRDRRDGRFDGRWDEERYGADRRYLPTSLAEVDTLRSRIASLRRDVEVAQNRPASNTDLMILAGTDLEVMLDAGLSSRWSTPGDRVEASTTAAVRRNGRTLIPAGATVAGVVTEVHSRRRGQQDGWVKLEFDSLIPDGGPGLPLKSHVVGLSATRSDSHAVRNGALGAVLGGVLGGVIEGKPGALIGAAVGVGGGLLASKGQEVDLPEGTRVVLRLDRPVTLQRRDVQVSRRY